MMCILCTQSSRVDSLIALDLIIKHILCNCLNEELDEKLFTIFSISLPVEFIECSTLMNISKRYFMSGSYYYELLGKIHLIKFNASMNIK